MASISEFATSFQAPGPDVAIRPTARVPFGVCIHWGPTELMMFIDVITYGHRNHINITYVASCRRFSKPFLKMAPYC